jgi:hypothetical protein
MKQILTAMARLLARAARTRAELVMHAQANAGVPQDYRANAGGWN